MPVNIGFVFYTDKRSIEINVFQVIKEALKNQLDKMQTG
jgi:hypothetical protein